jgi:hypothetical protein
MGIAMNQNLPQFPGDLAIATPTEVRLDERQRAIVDHGILVQQSSNTMSAFEYLKSRDVDPRVIERVLLEPQRRRRYS